MHKAAATSQTGPAPRIRINHAEDLPVVGWREWLSLPTLHVPQIKAKIDTGARTSSIHAFDVRPFTDRGAPHVSFVVLPRQRRRDGAISCVAEIRDERMVRSSSGHRQLRYVIQVEIGLAGSVWPIELTLADRDSMGFRMLLGREALRNRVLIDSRRSFIAGRSHADVSTVLIGKMRRL